MLHPHVCTVYSKHVKQLLQSWWPHDDGCHGWLMTFSLLLFNMKCFGHTTQEKAEARATGERETRCNTMKNKTLEWGWSELMRSTGSGLTNVGWWGFKGKQRPDMKLPVCSVAMTVDHNTKNTQLHDIMMIWYTDAAFQKHKYIYSQADFCHFKSTLVFYLRAKEKWAEALGEKFLGLSCGLVPAGKNRHGGDF